MSGLFGGFGSGLGTTVTGIGNQAINTVVGGAAAAGLQRLSAETSSFTNGAFGVPVNIIGGTTIRGAGGTPIGLYTHTYSANGQTYAQTPGIPGYQSVSTWSPNPTGNATRPGSYGAGGQMGPMDQAAQNFISEMGAAQTASDPTSHLNNAYRYAQELQGEKGITFPNHAYTFAHTRDGKPVSMAFNSSNNTYPSPEAAMDHMTREMARIGYGQPIRIEQGRSSSVVGQAQGVNPQQLSAGDDHAKIGQALRGLTDLGRSEDDQTALKTNAAALAKQMEAQGTYHLATDTEFFLKGNEAGKFMLPAGDYTPQKLAAALTPHAGESSKRDLALNTALGGAGTAVAAAQKGQAPAHGPAGSPHQGTSTTAATTPAPGAGAPAAAAAHGTHGTDDVRSVQETLNKFGIPTQGPKDAPSLIAEGKAADGIPGPHTEAAVRAMQTAIGNIPVTGKIDAGFVLALNHAANDPAQVAALTTKVATLLSGTPAPAVAPTVEAGKPALSAPAPVAVNPPTPDEFARALASVSLTHIAGGQDASGFQTPASVPAPGAGPRVATR